MHSERCSILTDVAVGLPSRKFFYGNIYFLSYLIPAYEYDRRIEGRLKGIRKVRMKDSDVELVVARVQKEDGKMMDVRLGSTNDLPGISRSLRPDAKVRAEGYRREVGGRSTFVVQDFKVLKEANKSQSENKQSDSNRSQK